MSRPNAGNQKCTPCRLIAPTGAKRVNGVDVNLYPTEAEEAALPIIFANVKSYGGTETVKNGLLVIEDTIVVTTWFRPDITADCRIRVLPGGALYEIINAPENWEMRNQDAVFKARRVRGGG
ncbi:MAG: head-tail adaptor protein [Clostridia bacterium]|nr:head-tail adaptor protein [Clostridia bacterium]